MTDKTYNIIGFDVPEFDVIKESLKIESGHASAYHYRVTFKPQVIIPDIDMRIDTTDGPVSQK